MLAASFAVNRERNLREGQKKKKKPNQKTKQQKNTFSLKENETITTLD